MRNIFHKTGEPLHRKLLRWLCVGLVMLACGLFIDWLVINLILGCCEGGVCWPDVYPQCRNSHYEEFYGKDR